MSAALIDPCFVLERRLSNHSTMCARGVKVQFFFGNHKLDTDRRELHRGSTPVAVEPQVFDLLKYLVENRDRVVSKDDDRRRTPLLPQWVDFVEKGGSCDADVTVIQSV